MLRIGLNLLFPLLFTFLSFSQVDTHFELKNSLFLSACKIDQKEWICGMEVTALDSTNKRLAVRFDLVKEWVEQDSLEVVVSLDTTQTYLQKIETAEFQAMKYVSQETGVTVFIAVPEKYEHTLSNGMHTVSWQFRYASVVLPPKWKKYQKHFRTFYEK